MTKGESLVLDASLKSLRISFSTRSGRIALGWLKNRAITFPEILLDGTVWDEDLVTLLYHARKHRPVTPISLVSPRNHLPAPILEKLGISGTRVAEPPVDTVDVAEGIATPLLVEGDYLGVPVVDFLEVGRATCDIHYKSPTGKFIPILHAGEEGVGTKASRYWQKGLAYLYISIPDYEAQLERIQEFGRLLYSREDLPAAMRTAHLIRKIGRKLEGLQAMEQVDDDLWNEISMDLNQIHSLWSIGPWSDPDSVLWNSSLLDHSTAVMVAALMLGRQLGFSTQGNFVRLGLAAAFHDLGLLGAPKALAERLRREWMEDPSKAPREFRGFLASHAERGANWVMDHLKADTVVAQAIRLHHWRQDQAQTGPGTVPRIAEIIGVAEELAQFVHAEDFAFKEGWIHEFREACSDRFSFAVLEALPPAFECRP